MTDPRAPFVAKPEHPDRKTGYERIRTDPPPNWFLELYPGGDGTGTLWKMQRHAAIHHERDAGTLVVSFDNIAVVNDLSFAREPWAWKFLHDRNHSHLGIVARTKAWFRDPEIIGFLEAREREGLFKRYDKVVMTGSSMGGFGALAFAPLAPGCTVLAFNPQSTLDDRLVPWETRYRYGALQDWDLPYGDAAETVAAAGRAYVIYDHFFEPDRRHAARIEGDNVTHLKSWFSNHFAAPMLKKLELLKPVMQGAIDGTLSEDWFYTAFRKRRTLPWYMRTMTGVAQEAGHGALAEKARKRFMQLRRAEKAEAAQAPA